MKILVTGATGFVGTHLCDYLLRKGDEVYGTYFEQLELDRFPEHLRQRVVLHQCDLSDLEQIQPIMEPDGFDRIYNLAAISSVHESWKGQDLVMNPASMTPLGCCSKQALHWIESSRVFFFPAVWFWKKLPRPPSG